MEGMNKAVQNLKVEIESTKRLKTEGTMEVNNLGTQTENSESILTNII